MNRGGYQGAFEQGSLASHILYAATAIAIILVLAFSLFATSFTLEESYPAWPQQPGLRIMPPVLAYVTLAEMAALLVSILWQRSRTPALIVAALTFGALWGAFFLIINDILISRGG